MFIPKLSINKTRFLKRLLLLIVVIMLIYWRENLLGVIMIIGDRDAIIMILGKYGVLGPVVLSMILGLQVFLAIIPGHAFIVAGGYVYGFILGVLITQVSTVAASQLAFLLTRRYGRPLVDRLVPAEVIDQWKTLTEKQGGLFFFFSFILPVFPNDLMCFVGGLSEISSRKFFLANFFGRLIVAILFTLIGSHGYEIPLYFWTVIVFILILITFFLRKFSKRIVNQLFKVNPTSKCLC